MIIVKAEHFRITRGSYDIATNNLVRLRNKKVKIEMITSGTDTVPSPKPKQGIKLSSSNGARVFPIIEMAFSYGFGVSPIACRLRLLNDALPSIKALTHWRPRLVVNKPIRKSKH